MLGPFLFGYRHALRRPWARAGLLSAFFGIVLITIPPLLNLSYDLSYLLRPSSRVTDLVLVMADARTLAQFGNTDLIDRTNHARLLDRLTREKARLVFYDFDFDRASSATSDSALEAALARNRSVVLVAPVQTKQTGGGFMVENHEPIAAFRTNAMAWGHAEYWGSLVRELPESFSYKDPAACVAANCVLAANSKHTMAAGARRWLNYYGWAGQPTFPTVAFEDAVSSDRRLVPDGSFSNKFVFVGQGFSTKEIGAQSDLFDTPFTRFGAPKMPGVEIHATAFLNLLRSEWLRMVPWWGQALLAALWGSVLVAVFYRISSQPLSWGLLTAVLAVVGLVSFSMLVQWKTSGHWWWGWFGPATAQTGAVFLWSRLYPRPARYDAFISYRRTPDLGNANSVYLGLRQKGYSVFLDLEQRKSGPFPARLRRGIEDAEFLLVILSPGCLAPRPESEDWMRAEIATARQHGKGIIPLLMPGFDFKAEAGNMSSEPLFTELYAKGEEAVRWHSDEGLDDFIQKIVILLRTSRTTKLKARTAAVTSEQ